MSPAGDEGNGCGGPSAPLVAPPPAAQRPAGPAPSAPGGHGDESGGRAPPPPSPAGDEENGRGGPSAPPAALPSAAPCPPAPAVPCNPAPALSAPDGHGTLALGASAAAPPSAGFPSTEGQDSLHFRLHPSVVMNFCEHCHRVKEQRACNWDGSSSPRPRILGFLIGVEHEQTVEIFTSIELVVEPISGTLERAFLEKNQELNKILFPAFDILGWYCTGMMYETDMQIHKALMGVNGRAFLLLLDDVEHFSVRNINRGMIILGNAALTVGESPLTFGTTHYTIEAVEIDEWKTTSNVFARSGEEREDASEAFRTMLFETPSGFTMFGIAEQVFEHPEIIWAWFAHRNDTKYVISTLGFIKVEKKPAEWNSDVGLGKDLEQFIQEKFSNRRKPLVVQNVQLKHAIEKELNIKCWFNSYIVRELTWGLNFTLDLLVPEEKEYQVFPLSIGLEKKIKTYGFDVSPQIIDRQFVNAVGFLNYLEFAWEKLLLILHDQFDHCFIESISDDEFPKVIESKLFSQEIVPKGGQYNRHDILNFLSLVLGIPDQKRVTMAHLKNMEAARLENVEAAWFENVEVAPLENVAAAISEDQSAASKSAAISEDQSAASKDSFSVSVAFICWTIFSLGFSIASIVTR